MDNAHCVSKYEQFENTINWDGLKTPTPLNQIRTFERNNPKITVNVYEYKPEEDDAIIPIYLTKHQARETHIDLLLLTKGEKCHYTFIRNMSRLIAHRTKHTAKQYVAPIAFTLLQPK